MMDFNKPPLSLREQIQKLVIRGLQIDNEPKAIHYLSNISFYRLRAYTYPFQDNNDSNHPFIKNVSFDDIIKLYVFDRKLRILIFDALEKIEVALRCKIIHEFSIVHGSHWYLNEDIYRNVYRFDEILDTLKQEIDRSNETFIEHYFKTYNKPSLPPAWMSLEVVSIGLLSKIYSNVSKGQAKKKIAIEFGIRKPEILESWIHSFVSVRNICAHHCRLWNRRFTITPVLLDNPIYNYIQNKEFHKNKLYAQLVCIKYLLNIISPNNKLTKKLKILMDDCPLVNANEMGFPNDWESESLWN